MKNYKVVAIALASAYLACVTNTHADDIDDAIRVIQSVEKFGEGNAEATKAMQTLNQAKPSDVPKLLDAINDSNPLAKNWIRSAIESALTSEGAKPESEIKTYFENKQNDPLGRLLAFELLTESNDELAQKMIPTFVEDPSLPLRRLAIAHFIESGKATDDKSEAIKIMQDTLIHARDVDQVQAIVEHLGTLDTEIDLAKQLGFITRWTIVGTYDNTDEKGFATEYKPEKALIKTPDPTKSISFESEFAGKTIEVHTTTESTGVVDVNKLYDNLKNAIVYAVAEFNSDTDQEVDIRIGCINGHKVWVNDQLVIENDIYHVGMQPDQFAGRAKLKKGINRIVIKVCQNDDKAPWAQNWMYQLRVCDETGKAILSTDRK